MSQIPPSSVFPPLGPATAQGATQAQGWDRCVLKDNALPGFCRITRGGIRLKVQRKPVKGKDGENPTFCGMDPQPIEIEIKTFTDVDRELLASIVSPLVPIPGRQPDPIPIDHPSLRMIGVYTVIFTGMTPLRNISPGVAVMSIEMLHWLPSDSTKNATTTPKGAPTRKVKNNRTTPNTPPTQQPGFGSPAGLHQ